LFGVISAVLLSIKGYLLNKSQESLITGVENWLQSRLVEDKSDEKSVVTKTNLQKSSRSYMDIFVEEMSSLNGSIQTLTSQQSELKENFKILLDRLSEEQKNTQKGFEMIAGSMKELSHTNLMVQDRLKDLFSMQELNRDESQKKERLLINMMTKQEKRDEELKIGIFEMVDAIENMDKNLKLKNTNIERLLRESIKSKRDNNNSKLDEIGEFMRRHLAKEDS